MGTFRAPIQIGDSQGQSWETVEALVDTGSTYTWIPRELLERLGVHAQFEREFETADGRIIRRDMAVTMVQWDGEAMPTLVVFGGDQDAALLGAYTLEGFALAPDPVNRRLVRVRGLAMVNTEGLH
ncbi:MAG: aspartyl protease family protein [Chloroflexi bacterium]|nr:aspartyl protease family protein [Chloroflexota bacterium]